MYQQALHRMLLNYPEFLKSRHLVELGIYPSAIAVFNARLKGVAPPHIKITTRKILYPKALLLQWLDNKMK